MDIAVKDHDAFTLMNEDMVTLHFDVLGHEMTDTRPAEQWRRMVRLLANATSCEYLVFDFGAVTDSCPVTVEFYTTYCNTIEGVAYAYQRDIHRYWERNLTSREVHGVLEAIENVVGGVG